MTLNGCLRGLLLALVVAAAGVVWFAAERYQAYLDTPLDVAGEGVTFEITPGTSFRGMVRQLTAAGLTRCDWPWRLYGRLNHPVLLSGEYFITPGMTPRQWLNRVRRGEVVVHHFTVVEGWTASELRWALAKVPGLLPCTVNLDDNQLAMALGHPAGMPIEGRFLPATYDFTRGVCDLDILKRAYRAMDKTLAEIWAGRAPELPYADPGALLTMASIIEKESSLPEERKQIAGVFVRRLKRGMRLQADPTVIYGLGAGFDGNLRRQDLKQDQPYNTYTRYGLPPGPIALPGLSALEAAAHPAPGDTLYFVASGNGDHVFAASLAEHERNVSRYQRDPARRSQKSRAAELGDDSGGDSMDRQAR